MRKIISIVFSMAVLFTKAQLSFAWARDFVGNVGSECNAVVTDANSNVYSVGRFTGTVDFDPGPATYTLYSANWQVAVTKLDPFGNFLWVKAVVGTQPLYAKDIALDPSGNIYVAGEFYGTADFDPGLGISNLTATNQDGYILKLDPNGNFIWAKSFSATNQCNISRICLAGTSSIYLTGNFNGTVDFDPGPLTYSLSGVFEVYVTKLDAGGNFVWAKQVKSSTSSALYANSVAFDGLNGIFVTGQYGGTADFDPGPAVFNVSTAQLPDAYILKLDTSGIFLWVRSFGGSWYDSGIDLITDAIGNVYTTGAFYNTVDFDPGPGVFNLSSSTKDVFILKLNSSGSFVYAKNFSGTVYSIDLDNTNNIFTTGTFTGTVDFDPGPASYTYSSIGNEDVFISKLDPTGSLLWAALYGGPGSDVAHDVRVDALGNVCTVGYYTNTADFDPGPGIYNLTSSSASTAFMHKMDHPSSQNVSGISKTDLTFIFPNPNNGKFTLILNKESQVIIRNPLGVDIYNKQLSEGKHEIEIQNIQSAIYYVTVRTENQKTETKLISILK